MTPHCPYCPSENSQLVQRLTYIDRYRCVKCRRKFTYRAGNPCVSGGAGNFFIYNHQGKGDLFERALIKAGYAPAEKLSSQIVLSDIDTPGRVNQLSDRITKGFTKLFCYPHAARPFVGWAGLFPPSGLTSASFVFAEGHIDVIRAYGYKRPLHSVGWAYSEIKPFRPTRPRRVLFAPIHPNNNGWLSNLDRGINSRTFQILLRLIETQGIELTVRHIKVLAAGGLWKDPRVKYVRGDTNTKQQDDMNNADVVISHQTYAYCAIARGIPTVMMAEDIPPRNGRDEASFKFVDRWDDWKSLLMYPLDILNTDDPWRLIQRACETDEDIRDWRHRMIGNKLFDPQKFVGLIKEYL